MRRQINLTKRKIAFAIALVVIAFLFIALPKSAGKEYSYVPEFTSATLPYQSLLSVEAGRSADPFDFWWEATKSATQPSPKPSKTPQPTPTTTPHPSIAKTSPSAPTGYKQFSFDECFAIAEKEAVEHGVKPALVHSLLTQESHHNNLAYSQGNYGMWQINLPSHPDITPEQAYDPAWSSHWAVVHLKGLLDTYGDLKGLAAYNAGVGGMQQGKGFGYAQQVLERVK